MKRIQDLRLAIDLAELLYADVTGDDRQRRARIDLASVRNEHRGPLLVNRKNAGNAFFELRRMSRTFSARLRLLLQNITTIVRRLRCPDLEGNALGDLVKARKRFFKLPRRWHRLKLGRPRRHRKHYVPLRDPERL